MVGFENEKIDSFSNLYDGFGGGGRKGPYRFTITMKECAWFRRKKILGNLLSKLLKPLTPIQYKYYVEVQDLSTLSHSKYMASGAPLMRKRSEMAHNSVSESDSSDANGPVPYELTDFDSDEDKL